MKHNRPYIICLMMSSVDGKILGHTWGDDPQVKKLLEHFEKAHEAIGINAWICGRSTMEKDFTFGQPPIYVEGSDILSRQDHVADKQAKSFAIAVDGSAKLGWKSPNLHGDHVITILTEQVPDNYLRHLQAIGVSYIFAGKVKVDLELAMTKLRELFHIEQLMLEGGGHLNGSFLEFELIDEHQQLILPLADGKANTATVFQFDDEQRNGKSTLFKLEEVKKIEDDVIWLRYLVHRKKDLI